MDEDIRRLRRAEPMKEDLLVLHDGIQLAAGNRRVVVRVVEALPVRGEGGGRELDPLQDVARVSPRLDVEDVTFLPGRASRGDGVRELLAVARDRHPGEGHGAVLRKDVRVEEHAGCGAFAVRDVEDRLILEAVVAGVKEAPPFPYRRRETFVVPELREALED